MRNSKGRTRRRERQLWNSSLKLNLAKKVELKSARRGDVRRGRRQFFHSFERVYQLLYDFGGRALRMTSRVSWHSFNIRVENSLTWYDIRITGACMKKLFRLARHFGGFPRRNCEYRRSARRNVKGGEAS